MPRPFAWLLLAALAAPSALAHGWDDDCGAAGHDTNDNGLFASRVHANAWTGGCVGVVASWDVVACAAIWKEPSTGPTHLLVLEGDGCRTGVLVQP